MVNAIARAMNLRVRKFLAKKLTIFLVYAPKSIAAIGLGGTLAP